MELIVIHYVIIRYVLDYKIVLNYKNEHIGECYVVISSVIIIAVIVGRLEVESKMK